MALLTQLLCLFLPREGLYSQLGKSQLNFPLFHLSSTIFLWTAYNRHSIQENVQISEQNFKHKYYILSMSGKHIFYNTK